MMKTGLFIRTTLSDFLHRLEVSKAPVAVVQAGREANREVEEYVACAHDHRWVHIDTGGLEAVEVLLVEHLASEEGGLLAIRCRFDRPEEDFFFEIVGKGRVLEGFHSAGGGWDALEFSSELRQIPAQHMLDPADFMLESLREHGLTAGGDPGGSGGKVRLRMTAGEKNSSWMSRLFGAAWWGG